MEIFLPFIPITSLVGGGSHHITEFIWLRLVEMPGLNSMVSPPAYSNSFTEDPGLQVQPLRLTATEFHMSPWKDVYGGGGG